MVYAVAAVAFAVAVAFLHPAIIKVVDEIAAWRKAKERERLEKEMKDACATGNSARIVALRVRLQKLDD